MTQRVLDFGMNCRIRKTLGTERGNMMYSEMSLSQSLPPFIVIQVRCTLQLEAELVLLIRRMMRSQKGVAQLPGICG